MKTAIILGCVFLYGTMVVSANNRPISAHDSTIAIDETRSTVYTHGIETGTARTKILSVNGNEIPFPHELKNDDAIKLVQGKESAVTYTKSHWEASLPFWEQLLCLIMVTEVSESTTYTIEADRHGYFIAQSGLPPTRETVVNWWFIAVFCCSAIFLLDTIIRGKIRNHFKAEDHAVNIWRSSVYIITSIPFFVVIMASSLSLCFTIAELLFGGILSRPETLVLFIGPFIWYWTIFIITAISLKVFSQTKTRRLNAGVMH